MKITTDQLDELGKISDSADNFWHASKLKLPPALHSEQLAMGMVDICNRLRKLYIEISGENAWDDYRPLTTDRRPPTTDCRAPTTDRRLPTTENR